MIAPTPPIKLMTPLAWLRSALGVISGMRAMTGVRNTAIARSMVMMETMNVEFHRVLLVG